MRGYPRMHSWMLPLTEFYWQNKCRSQTKHSYARQDISIYLAFNFTHSFIQLINLGMPYVQLFAFICSCVYDNKNLNQHSAQIDLKYRSCFPLMHLQHSWEMRGGLIKEKTLIKTSGPLLSSGKLLYCFSNTADWLFWPQWHQFSRHSNSIATVCGEDKWKPTHSCKRASHTHAAKLHTVNTHTYITINKPHLLFSHSFSINPIQWKCGRLPDSAVMELLVKENEPKTQQRTYAVALVGFLFWRMKKLSIVFHTICTPLLFPWKW